MPNTTVINFQAAACQKAKDELAALEQALAAAMALHTRNAGPHPRAIMDRVDAKRREVDRLAARALAAAEPPR